MTTRAARVLNFIRVYRQVNGYSPTCREIADHMGLRSAQIEHYLKRLEADGHIRRVNGWRKIRLVEEGVKA